MLLVNCLVRVINSRKCSSLVISDLRPTMKLEDLPLEILGNIFSWLPAKEAVRNRLLSRIFEGLWRHVPNLFFELESEDVDEGTLFEQFVDFVLAGRAAPIVRIFSLHCHDNVQFQSISRWLEYSVNHMVQELQIRLEIEHIDDEVDPLPVALFSCQSVVKLELCTYGRLIFPAGNEGMRELRIWTLQHAEFVDGPSTTQFFAQCPRLEKLTLERCTWSCQLVQITCPLLRSVIIHFGPDDDEEIDSQVEINAPRLEFFEYQGDAEVEYRLVECSNLLEANINVLCPLEVLETLAERTTRMVGGLSSVRTLAISRGTLQILNTYYDSLRGMTQFENLNMLTVTGNAVDVSPNSELLEFLKLCNSLVHLEGREGMFCRPHSSHVDNLPLPICLNTTLSTIAIRNFEGTRVQVYAVWRWLNISTATVYLYFQGREEEREFRGSYGGFLRSFTHRLHIRQ